MTNGLAKNLILSLAGGLIAFSSLVTSAHASEGVSECQPIYGGGQICQEISKFTLDKKVQRLTKGGEFVDNLSIGNEKFSPNQEVVFKITIKNTGDNTIENLDVADTLRKELTFVDGSADYNEDTRTLTYTIDSLASGQTSEFTFTARAVQKDDLASDNGIICTVNRARATDQNGNTAEDTSEICIQKEVPTQGGPQVFETPDVKKIPETGPGLLALAGLLPAGITGFFLRKYAK